MADEALQLEQADGHRSPVTLGDANEVLGRYGARLWPLDLSAAPEAQRRLLGRPVLSPSENAAVLDHFQLTREQLLALIAEAGRAPGTPGGGEMSTLDTTHGVPYPELYLVEPGTDYSRFDRLHVNHTTDGTGVDETLQLLAGANVRFVHSMPGVGRMTLYLSCPAPDHGWTLSYSGAHAHIASFTDCTEGTKILMQIIGPARWIMDYVDATDG
jgi:hypothetical protein